MSITRLPSELIDRIAESSLSKRVQVKRIVQQFLDEIVNELGKGNRLEFRDFGVFETKQRKARRAQNPRTLEPVKVPEKRTVKFKVGRLMKQRLGDLTGTAAGYTKKETLQLFREQTKLTKTLGGLRAIDVYTPIVVAMAVAVFALNSLAQLTLKLGAEVHKLMGAKVVVLHHQPLRRWQRAEALRPQALHRVTRVVVDVVVAHRDVAQGHGGEESAHACGLRGSGRDAAVFATSTVRA